MLRDEAVAHQLAEKLRQDFPESTRAASLWVQTAPASMEFDVLEHNVPNHLRSDPEVAVALAVAAAQADRHDIAETYARAAVAKNKDWIDARIVLANTVIGAESRAHHERPAIGQRRARIEESRDALAEAIRKVSPSTTPLFVAHLRCNLAAAHYLLGDDTVAKNELRDLLHLATEDEVVAVQVSSLLLEYADHTSAVNLLRAHAATSLRAKLLLAEALAQRNHAGDRTEARNLLSANLEAISNAPPRLRAASVDLLAQLHLESKNHMDAQRLLEGEQGKLLPEECRQVLLAQAAEQSGDSIAALERAQQAKILLQDHSNPHDARRLAILFEKLGNPLEALTVWKSFITPGSDNKEICHVLGLASQARDEEFIIGFCSMLRAHGKVDLRYLDVELVTLERVSPTKAIDVIREMLASIENELILRYLRLRLSLLGLRTNRPELIERNPSLLPRIGEITSRMCVIAVLALRESDDPLAPVRAAYELIRKYPNTIEPYQAMMAAMGMGREKHPNIPVPTAAGPGSAVQYKDEETGRLEWCIIEESVPPQPVMREIAPDGELARALDAKKPGDHFELPVAFGPCHSATVVQVISKFIYRYQTCFTEVPNRFKDQHFLTEIPVVHKPGGDVDFSSLYKQLEHKDHEVERVASVYRDHPMPVHMFARAMGCSVIAAMRHIATAKDMMLRCCEGSTQEREQAIEGLRQATDLVIEPTALATLFSLDDCFDIAAIDALKASGFTLLVSEHAVDELRKFFASLAPDADRIAIRRVGNQVVPAITPASVMKRTHEKLTQTIQTIERLCTVVPGSTLSAFAPEIRSQLEKLCGRACLESIALAAQQKRVLWTDDAIIAALSNAHLPAPRVWTQLLYQYLAELGRLVPHMAEDVAIRLLQLKYEYTALSTISALRAAEVARWDINDPAFAAVLDRFSHANTQLEGLILIAAQLLRTVWLDPVLGWQAQQVTFRILDRLKLRPDGTDAVRTLYQAADQLMGLHVVSASLLKDIIRTWQAGNRSPGIVLP